jgi:hypothetical protein
MTRERHRGDPGRRIIVNNSTSLYRATSSQVTLFRAPYRPSAPPQLQSQLQVPGTDLYRSPEAMSQETQDYSTLESSASRVAALERLRDALRKLLDILDDLELNIWHDQCCRPLYWRATNDWLNEIIWTLRNDFKDDRARDWLILGFAQAVWNDHEDMIDRLQRENRVKQPWKVAAYKEALVRTKTALLRFSERCQNSNNTEDLGNGNGSETREESNVHTSILTNGLPATVASSG